MIYQKRIHLFIIILLPLLGKAQQDSIKDRNKYTLIFPVVTRSIETSWSFGAATSTTFRISKKDTVSRTSNIQVVGIYSLKNQLVTAIEGSQYFKDEKFILTEEISYSSFPDKFWGIGSSAPESALENYNFKQYYINPHLFKSIGKKFFIGALLEIQQVLKIDYQKGGLFDVQNVAGRNGYFIAGLGTSIAFDSRTNAFYPTKGTYAQLYFNHFDKYLGSDYVYSSMVLNVRKYLPVRQNVIALQAYYLGTLGDEIPLRSLAALGGGNSMRGFYSGRYRDKAMGVLQAEYRMQVYKRLGAVVFGGTGDVASSWKDLSFDALKYSYGAGLRFAVNKKEKLNIRIDYGFAAQGNSGLYFQLGEAF